MKPHILQSFLYINIGLTLIACSGDGLKQADNIKAASNEVIKDTATSYGWQIFILPDDWHQSMELASDSTEEDVSSAEESDFPKNEVESLYVDTYNDLVSKIRVIFPNLKFESEPYSYKTVVKEPTFTIEIHLNLLPGKKKHLVETIFINVTGSYTSKAAIDKVHALIKTIGHKAYDNNTAKWM